MTCSAAWKTGSRILTTSWDKIVALKHYKNTKILSLCGCQDNLWYMSSAVMNHALNSLPMLLINVYDGQVKNLTQNVKPGGDRIMRAWFGFGELLQEVY